MPDFRSLSIPERFLCGIALGLRSFVDANVHNNNNNNNNPQNKNLQIFRILLFSAKAKWLLKETSTVEFLTVIIFLKNRALCVQLCMAMFISIFFF